MANLQTIEYLGGHAILRLEGGGLAPPSRLLTRAHFLDRVARELRRMKGSPFDKHVVLLIDIDRFKVVNAGAGRRAGDQVLNATAGRINSLLSPSDSLARMGGDEFAVLFEERREGMSALELADAIQRELITGFSIDDNTIYATASIGIVRVAPTYQCPEAILRDGEIAMYGAKRRGNAGIEVFHPAMFLAAQELFQLEMDLRRAAERKEFELHYQPIISVETGKIRAFESLLRWRHPSRGMQMPSAFLPLLKETGLLISVCEWVIEEACIQAKKWEELAGEIIPVTINLSPQQFTHAEIGSCINAALEKTGLNPSGLMLEITEDALIESLDEARSTLLSLRDRGVRTMISGLGIRRYLRRVPIDAIKIDSSFIDRLERYNEDLMIVRSIITLAHALDLGVVAMGVERHEQLVELKRLGCDQAQGYVISPAVEASTAAGMVGTGWQASTS